MEGLSSEGRTELMPDTVSFNTVIDALARSGSHGAPQRAEVLLQRMDDLSKGDAKFPCEPDTRSFNIVINGWAKVSYYMWILNMSRCYNQSLTPAICIVSLLYRAENQQLPIAQTLS